MVIRSKDVKKFSVLNLANRSFSYFSEAFPADPKAGQPDIKGLVISMNEKFILCTNNMSSNIFIFDINTLKKDDELKGKCFCLYILYVEANFVIGARCPTH